MKDDKWFSTQTAHFPLTRFEREVVNICIFISGRPVVRRNHFHFLSHSQSAFSSKFVPNAFPSENFQSHCHPSRQPHRPGSGRHQHENNIHNRNHQLLSNEFSINSGVCVCVSTSGNNYNGITKFTISYGFATNVSTQHNLA